MPCSPRRRLAADQDLADLPVDVVVDATAAAGDVVPVLARLLIGLARKRIAERGATRPGPGDAAGATVEEQEQIDHQESGTDAA